jgi:hypothetical protein
LFVTIDDGELVASLGEQFCSPATDPLRFLQSRPRLVCLRSLAFSLPFETIETASHFNSSARCPSLYQVQLFSNLPGRLSRDEKLPNHSVRLPYQKRVSFSKTIGVYFSGV